MESKECTNSNWYSDIIAQNIWSKLRYQERMKMYLRRQKNLYFDSINSNFYRYTCSSNVGTLPSIKFLSLNMCNLDQGHFLLLWLESRCVQLEPGTLNLEYCKRNILKHVCLKFNTSAIHMTLINWVHIASITSLSWKTKSNI